MDTLRINSIELEIRNVATLLPNISPTTFEHIDANALDEVEQFWAADIQQLLERVRSAR
jgi:hypothetical protein